MKTNSLDFDAQALREKILDLAMRGKLIKQDPNDESASVLLEKIKAEKAKLVKEGKIKKNKPLPEITDDEKPFDIPDSWEWVHVKDVTTIGNFHSVSPQNINQGENLIELADIESNTGRLLNFEKVTSEVGSNKYQYNQGDVLFAKLRPYLRKVLIAPNDGICTTELLPINGIQTSNIYIYYTFLSSLIFEQIRQEMHGVNLPRISPKKLAELIIPLPPLSEQSRIAAKIAQLFALLRKVETSTQQYTKLQTLLKSKVLDLAMRGKLVKQDPNDEPASVLLEKIKAEKEQLIKEKKMKKSKPLPPIADDEKPFEIPDSWEWVRLGEVNTYIGKNIHPEKTPEQLFELYSVPIYETNSPEITSGKEIKSNKQTVIPDDILLCKINPRINRVWRVGNYTNYKNIASTEWIVVRQSQLLPDYLRYVLMSPYFRKLLQSNVSGVGGSLTRAKPVLVKKYVIPIPPLSEQSRISLKIAHLFTLLK
ncbi:restriction endonuclease subunit S [Lactobacillus johnsonii]|uniref:restriction endonuclease subunit S n=1 Tax=Lactobacillus johnsonii TaxID=33959 RepID=UPI0014746354|nr:restriction endonuclease subunit S [Lactobacillus johnsonii]NME20453.1 restriction endonuclease subunit S [Lactobacillus johnsonii]